MTNPRYPVASGVIDSQRRSMIWWSIAVAAVAVIYISYYPAIGGEQMQELVDIMPEGFVEALGYDQVGTAAGYIDATVYTLLGPALLLGFAIGTGARLIAGQEEDGTLELELTAPIPHRRQYAERLAALWFSVMQLTLVLAAATALLIVVLSLDVSFVNLIAASFNLLLFGLAFGTIAFAVGAATGRRVIALAIAAGLAVAAYMLNAIGPTIDAGWMTAISPWSWHAETNPVQNGWDLRGATLLLSVAVLAGVAGVGFFRRRDLMV